MKKKIGILLAFAMILTLLTGCAVGGGNSDVGGPDNDTITNDSQQDQPNNSEESGNSYEKIEGTYWLYVRQSGGGDEAFGFYFDGNGTYVELILNEYKEYTYSTNAMHGIYETDEYTRYMFSIFDESGNNYYREYDIWADGKIHESDTIYAPVTEEEFYAYAPKPEPEPTPEPEKPSSKYPFDGKYYTGRGTYLTHLECGVYFDGTTAYFKQSKHTFSGTYSYEGSRVVIYSDPNNLEEGFKLSYSEETQSFYINFNSEGSAEGEVILELSNKEAYDAVGTN